MAKNDDDQSFQGGAMSKGQAAMVAELNNPGPSKLSPRSSPGQTPPRMPPASTPRWGTRKKGA